MDKRCVAGMAMYWFGRTMSKQSAAHMPLFFAFTIVFGGFDGGTDLLKGPLG